MFTDWKLGLELERKNNNDSYYKENCAWVDRKTQCRNMRSTKLTAEQVQEIRGLRRKEPTRVTAARYNVSSSHISRIQTGQKWG